MIIERLWNSLIHTEIKGRPSFSHVFGVCAGTITKKKKKRQVSLQREGMKQIKTRRNTEKSYADPYAGP